MMRLWSVGLILAVIVIAVGAEPEPEKYERGNLILNIRQFVQKSSSCGCDNCPKNTLPACRYLGGTCMQCSKKCNGERIKGPTYCKGHCSCCVPGNVTIPAVTTVEVPGGGNEVEPTTEASTPRPRMPRSSGCMGKWNGLPYTGTCKADCAVPTPMVETYDHSCQSPEKCCIEEPLQHCNISGTPYKSGKRFDKNCLMFECEDGTLTSNLKYNKECADCSGKNDPHFVNFDKIKYDWHGPTDGILVQEGNEECGTHFVGMGFAPCSEGVAGATCYDHLYYKTASGVEISVPRGNGEYNPVVIVDGKEQTLQEEVITVLKGAGDVEVNVIGFMKDECMHIMGVEDYGFLVKACSFQVNVYAYPTLQGGMSGLCGSWEGIDAYVKRDGTQLPRIADKRGKMYLPSEVGLDWEMPACMLPSRRRRDANTHAINLQDPCINATDAVYDGFNQTCLASINSPTLAKETRDELIENCIFDLCFAIVVAEDPELGDSFLSETAAVATQAESAANDTIQYPPGQPGAPNATIKEPMWVTLEWAEPEGAATANIQKYIIKRKDLDGGPWVQCGEVNAPLTEATITDVEDGFEYIFQVIAVSEAGESEASDPSPSMVFATPYIPTTVIATTTTEATTMEANVPTEAATIEPEVPTEAATVEPEVPTEAATIEPEVPTEAATIEPEVPTEAATVEPEVPTEAATIEPEVPTEAVTVEPEVPTEAATIEPEVPTEPVTVEPEVPTEAATIEPEVPTEAATIEPEVPTEAVTEEAIVPTEAATEEAIVPTEAATEEAIVPTEAPTMEPEVPTEAVTMEVIEPTTEAPATVEDFDPTTEAPATVEDFDPTTEAPATIEDFDPTTEAPATVEVFDPTTEAPATVEVFNPTTEAPATVEDFDPTTEAPATAEVFDPTTEAAVELTTEAAATDDNNQPTMVTEFEVKVTTTEQPKTTLPYV